MAFEGYLTFEFAKQGKNKGTSLAAAHKDKIPFTAFEYQVSSGREAATGQAAGRRQHQPVRIVKEWDANTPMLLQALVTNEQVKTARFEFVRVDRKTGEEQIYFQVTLTGGSITQIQQTIGGGIDTPHSAAPDRPHVEAVHFNFDKIAWEHLIDKTKAEDSTSGR